MSAQTRRGFNDPLHGYSIGRPEGVNLTGTKSRSPLGYGQSWWREQQPVHHVTDLPFLLSFCGLCGVASIRFNAASRRATVSSSE